MAPKANPVPSATQLETLHEFIHFVELHGYQPSQAEMAKKLGLSPNAIASRLREMARRGLIETGKGSRDRALKFRHVVFGACFTGDLVSDVPYAWQTRLAQAVATLKHVSNERGARRNKKLEQAIMLIEDVLAGDE